MLDVGALWLYDKPLQMIIPVAEGQGSMAVLVGFKQLVRIKGDGALGRVTDMLLPLPHGDDNVAAEPRHMLDALDLEPAVEAESGGADGGGVIAELWSSQARDGWKPLGAAGKPML